VIGRTAFQFEDKLYNVGQRRRCDDGGEENITPMDLIRRADDKLYQASTKAVTRLQLAPTGKQPIRVMDMPTRPARAGLGRRANRPIRRGIHGGAKPRRSLSPFARALSRFDLSMSRARTTGSSRSGVIVPANRSYSRAANSNASRWAADFVPIQPALLQRGLRVEAFQRRNAEQVVHGFFLRRQAALLPVQRARGWLGLSSMVSKPDGRAARQWNGSCTRSNNSRSQ